MAFPFQLIELTHMVSDRIPLWDDACHFQHQNLLDYGDCNEEVKFRVQSLCMPAGIGTHIDAPAHCNPFGKTVDALSLQDCLAPCIVIDISAKADANYRCSVDDILNFEKHYQTIKAGDFVLINTGWARYWTSPEQYRNNLQFPSVSKEAAQLLIERKIVGLGIDTLGPDIGDSGYPVHQLLLGQNKYLIENIANAHALPPLGSYIFAAALFLRDGTEAPVRLVGFLPSSHEIHYE